MNTMFIAHGAIFAAAGVIVARSSERGMERAMFGVLALVHGAGIALVGVFHGSAEALANGTLVVHGVGAAMAIIAGNVAAIRSGSSRRLSFVPVGLRRPSIVLGVLGLVSVGMLVVNQAGGAPVLFEDGVFERLSVHTFIAWELTIGIMLLTRPGVWRHSQRFRGKRAN